MQMIIPKQMTFQSRARPYHRAEKLSCQKIELERDNSIDKQYQQRQDTEGFRSII